MKIYGNLRFATENAIEVGSGSGFVVLNETDFYEVGMEQGI